MAVLVQATAEWSHAAIDTLHNQPVWRVRDRDCRSVFATSTRGRHRRCSTRRIDSLHPEVVTAPPQRTTCRRPALPPSTMELHWAGRRLPACCVRYEWASNRCAATLGPD